MPPALRSAVPSARRDSKVDRMSPARPEKSLHLGDAIVAEMRAARLPFGPRQFEFCFAYKSGRNAALNAAANEITAANGALTGADIERLHETYLSPAHGRKAGRRDGADGRQASAAASRSNTRSAPPRHSAKRLPPKPPNSPSRAP